MANHQIQLKLNIMTKHQNHKIHVFQATNGRQLNSIDSISLTTKLQKEKEGKSCCLMIRIHGQALAEANLYGHWPTGRPQRSSTLGNSLVESLSTCAINNVGTFQESFNSVPVVLLSKYFQSELNVHALL